MTHTTNNGVRSMAVRATMVSRPTGTRVHTTSTNLTTGTGSSSVKVEELFVAPSARTDPNTDAPVAIMADSGAAVHVCSPTFGAGFPLQKLTPEETPPQRSVTDGSRFLGTSIRYMPGTSFSSVITVLLSAVWLHPSDPGRCEF